MLGGDIMTDVTWGDLSQFTWGEISTYTWENPYPYRLKDTLITDRTSADVRNRTAKGVYSAEDLNRVEAATQIISNKLTEAGYVTTVSVKTGWTMGEFPYDTEMARYMGNVKRCVDNFAKMPTTPDLPGSMDYLTHTGANTIEQCLADIDELLGNMKKCVRYSGTFYSGTPDGLRGNAM